LVEGVHDLGYSLLSLGLGEAQYDEVLGVADEAETERVELPVQVVGDNVGQEWTNHSALRCDHGSGLKHTFVHDPRAKEFLDKVKDIAVGDLGRDCFLDKGLREMFEKAVDIGIEQYPITLLVVLQGQLQGLMAVAFRTEAEGRLVEERFEDGG
jgi:hypothetical protein